jgi:hypothetical protein
MMTSGYFPSLFGILNSPTTLKGPDANTTLSVSWGGVSSAAFAWIIKIIAKALKIIKKMETFFIICFSSEGVDLYFIKNADADSP